MKEGQGLKGQEWAYIVGFLLLAGLLTLVATGRWQVAAAAWLAPVFMVRFLRSTRVGVGLGCGAAVQAAAYLLAWRGVLPFTGIIYVAVAAGLGLILFLPFLLDRIMKRRMTGFWATLLLPLAWVTVEFALASAGFGSWGLIAYTQSGALPLLQLLSVTGMWGITFLIGWCAAILNWAWEQQFRGHQVRWGVGLYAGLLAVVLLGGGARLAIFTPKAPTVRVASITVPNMDAFMETWLPVRRGRPLSPEALDRAQAKTAHLHASLLAQTQQEARQGAKLVFWSEGNALVFKADEPTLIAQGQALAAAEQIYLLMALATVTPGNPLVENKVVGIGPEGEVLSHYLKSQPAPGEGSVPGDGRIPVASTPLGRLAWAICFDFDYQGLIRQAGQARADIMLNPSWDSPAIDPLHTKMAMLRAIENGFSLIRQTNDGLSMAVDYQGNVLASLDHDATSESPTVMIAHVPMRGGRTLYAQVGDLFAWLCAVGLLLWITAAVRRRRAPIIQKDVDYLHAECDRS